MTLLHQVLHVSWLYFVLLCVKVGLFHILMVGYVVIDSAIP